MISPSGTDRSSLPPFLHAQTQITSDAWVFWTVQGFQIEWEDSPAKLGPPPPMSFSCQKRFLIHLKLVDLHRKGAIESLPLLSAGLVSNIFLLEKKGVQMRPVISLCPLNNLVFYRHLNMEGIHFLRDTLRQGKWMSKLNLKDAYLTVPVAEYSQDQLNFCWNNRLWRFTCLLFGFASAS